MILTKTKINHHKLSVVLTKVRLFRCYKTHVDRTWYQKERSRKEEEEHKNKEEHKKYNFRFNIITIKEEKNNLH